jgi:hypothetical protein
MRRFGQQILGGLVERLNARLFGALRMQLAPVREQYFQN